MQLARLQALMILLWMASVLAMVGVYFDLSPVLAWVGGSALVLGPALVLGLEFLALHQFGRTALVPAASAAQLWRAWACEVWAALVLFGWRQPFCSWRHADQLGPQHRGVRGWCWFMVICATGGCGSSGCSVWLSKVDLLQP